MEEEEDKDSDEEPKSKTCDMSGSDFPDPKILSKFQWKEFTAFLFSSHQLDTHKDKKNKYDVCGQFYPQTEQVKRLDAERLHEDLTSRNNKIWPRSHVFPIITPGQKRPLTKQDLPKHSQASD